MKERIACKLKWYFLGLARKRIQQNKYNKTIDSILFHLTNKLYKIERGD